MAKFEPNSKVNTNELILIANKSWPKDCFREITDISTIKEFYNNSYKNFHSEIEVVLSKYHPASWIRISYIQLELWTLRLLHIKNQPKEMERDYRIFPPIARYGWRYILEISLEKNDVITSEFHSLRPSDEDVSKIFTLLIGLSYCAEISDFMHYFKDKFSTSKIVFSRDLYTKFPQLEESAKSSLHELIGYYDENVDYDIIPESNYVNNQELLFKIDALLSKHFNFCLADIDKIIDVLRDRVTLEIGATILVMPTASLISMLSEYTLIPAQKIYNIVNFIFFQVSDSSHEKRNYLKKSQNTRMLNFAGCKFDVNKNFETIYEDNALMDDSNKMFRNHCLISFTLLWEWRINFIERLIFGKRIDLKEINDDLKIDISKIEHYFHRTIFEGNIKNVLISKGLQCISIEEIEKKKLPCGEIDALAIDIVKNTIYVIEAKNLSPVKDARASGRVISDHYLQKKYHAKFLKKISWVQDNLVALSRVFNVELNDQFIIEKFFVTGSPSPMKFLITDYKVLTYFEFFNLIKEKYEQN